MGAGYCRNFRSGTRRRYSPNAAAIYCELVLGANQMPRLLKVAIREAVGRRGILVIVIPGNIPHAAEAPLAMPASLLPPRPAVLAGAGRSGTAGGPAQTAMAA
jgi:hypothetical protein